ncbi:hypothetical protein EYF80_000542 [Liparis tanakae]|uniref:Uncharacterized protein n=1 Tax=Liparis tanakae TaxID=230148 RepID=A0A4Z2JHN2_9TELE|nr:hypothetical protein EYF80_000542 [Liparis tanakae]
MLRRSMHCSSLSGCHTVSGHMPCRAHMPTEDSQHKIQDKERADDDERDEVEPVPVGAQGIEEEEEEMEAQRSAGRCAPDSTSTMKRDLLTVKQFSLTGMGLYRAMVRARCALVCLKAGEMPPVDIAVPSRFRLRSDPPSPGLNKPGTSSPNRAILSGGETAEGKEFIVS